MEGEGEGWVAPRFKGHAGMGIGGWGGQVCATMAWRLRSVNLWYGGWDVCVCVWERGRERGCVGRGYGRVRREF